MPPVHIHCMSWATTIPKGQLRVAYMSTVKNNRNLDFTKLGQAAGFLQALGGAGNIESINNCATRLRIALVDMAKTQSDDVFKALGAHGVVRRGNGIQVIVGLHVPQVRDQLETLIKDSLQTEQTTMTEAVS